jgi:plastocyanin
VGLAERAERRRSGRGHARALLVAVGVGFVGAAVLLPLTRAAPPANAADRADPVAEPAALKAPKSVTVRILASSVEPATVNVVPGATVIWVNDAGSTRSILASDASFDSGSLSDGERFQFAFTQARTVSYSVVQAPGVSGTVVVAAPGVEAPAPAPAPFAPPAAGPTDPQPAGFAYTGSATAINGLIGGLALAFGAGLVMTARRFGVVATLSRLTFSFGPDDLLPTRRHRRTMREAARRRGSRR